MARYFNIVIGTAIIVICILELVTIFADFVHKPGAIFLNLYLCCFGLIIIGSSMNIPCVARNFFFLLTGIGKGTFNIFVGFLLFLNRPKEFSPSQFLGWILIVSGIIFFLLAWCKQMTDEDLQRATSLYGQELREKATRNTGRKF